MRLVVYRVFRVSDDLRERLKSRRQNRTTYEIVQQAVRNVPRILHSLDSLGFDGCDDKRPMRLPLNDRIISQLNAASGKCGIPAAHLLLAALSLTLEEGEGSDAK